MRAPRCPPRDRAGCCTLRGAHHHRVPENARSLVPITKPVVDAIKQRAPLQSSALVAVEVKPERPRLVLRDRKSTRLNSSHLVISYAVFCLIKKDKHLNMIAIKN